jgi:predicted secreted acid phosphatase
VTRRMLSAAVLALLVTMSLLVAPAQGAGLPSKKQWLSDTHTAMSGSRTWLKGALKDAGKHPAVNLDIDNTSLASHYAPGHAVPVVLRFVKYAHYKGVTILFSTGRRDNALRGVIKTLRKAGFTVNGVCGRKEGESLSAGKQRCRAYWTSRGHEILANVGNRATDFTGGNYKRGFKLPDYDKQLS